MVTRKFATQSLKYLLILTAVTILRGCFVSNTPMVTPKNADYPFERITFISVLDSDDIKEEVTLVRDGDNYVELGREDEGQYRLAKVETDLFIGQVIEVNDDGENEVLYGVVYIENNNTFHIIAPTCDLAPEDLLKAAGIKKTETQYVGECGITSLDQLFAFARLVVKTDTKRDTYRIVKIEK